MNHDETLPDEANLPTRYQELQKNYSNLQRDFEIKCQELHDCRRFVKAAEAVEKDYQDEIRLLQSEGSTENRTLKAKIQALEESTVSLKGSYHDRIVNFEKELSGKNDLISDLKRELEDIVKISATQTGLQDDLALTEQIDTLQQESLELIEKIEELQTSLDTYSSQNQELQDKIVNLQFEIDNLKESLHCKKEQLDEANDLIQILRNDCVLTKTELDALKSKPLDDNIQGNSLFAEVNDRRLQLEKSTVAMKNKYVEIQKEHSSLLKQIRVLRNENAVLTAKFEAEINERNRDDDMILHSYKNQIKVLNEVIESYKKELKENSQLPETCFYKQIEGMLNIKNQEIENLRQKLASRSINQSVLSHDLASEKREKCKLSLEIVKLKNEIGELKVQIEELRFKSPTEVKAPVTFVEGPPVKSILKVEKVEEPVITIDDKENDRKVKFTAETSEGLEKKSAIPRRRGAKILVSNPINIITSGNAK